jgi:hypothetical protein
VARQHTIDAAIVMSVVHVISEAARSQVEYSEAHDLAVYVLAV